MMQTPQRITEETNPTENNHILPYVKYIKFLQYIHKLLKLNFL